MKKFIKISLLLYLFQAIVVYSQVTQQWLKTYDGPVSGEDTPGDIKTDNNGNVYITGNSMGNNSLFDIATIKYNSQGVKQWVARYSNSCGYKIALAQSGNVYIAGGKGLNDNHFGSSVIIKYNNNGNQIWAVTLGDTGAFWDVKLDNAENIYAAGMHNKSLSLIKLNPSGGIVWTVYYNDSNSVFSNARGLNLDLQGNIYVFGLVVLSLSY
jgi:hypothetical protein